MTGVVDVEIVEGAYGLLFAILLVEQLHQEPTSRLKSCGSQN